MTPLKVADPDLDGLGMACLAALVESDTSSTIESSPRSRAHGVLVSLAFPETRALDDRAFLKGLNGASGARHKLPYRMSR